MELNQFIAKVKSCRASALQTGYTSWKFFPAVVNPERTRWKLTCETERTRFKDKEKKTLIINFFKEQTLSVFEAEMMLIVFTCRMRPIDYGSFHECIHGKEFIANIKSIETEDRNDLLIEFHENQKKQKKLLERIKEFKVIQQ